MGSAGGVQAASEQCSSGLRDHWFASEGCRGGLGALLTPFRYS